MIDPQKAIAILEQATKRIYEDGKPFKPDEQRELAKKMELAVEELKLEYGKMHAGPHSRSHSCF